MSGTKLGIRIFTRADELELGEGIQVLSATRKLLHEVEKSITGKPKAEIEWSLVALHWQCDGCGKQRPTIHDDWKKVDAKDYCPSCSKNPDLEKP